MTDVQMIDRADRALLAVLQHDARARLTDLAEKASLSVSATRARLQGLQERGVITGFAARVDPAALGYALRAVVRMRVHGALYDKVTAFIADEPQIVRCLRTTGETCYLIEVVAVDMADLARITSGLAHIGSLTTDMIYEVVSETDLVAPAAAADAGAPTW